MLVDYVIAVFNWLQIAILKVKVKLSLCLTNWTLRYDGVWNGGRVDQRFLTSAIVGGKWPVSRFCRFNPRERTPGTHWMGGGVDPIAGLDDMDNLKLFTLPGLELRLLYRPAHSL
jgi:hypothetical protein